MRTSARARSAQSPPDERPMTVCWASCVQSKARTTLVAEVGAADGLVSAKGLAAALERDPADLEDVRARGCLQREVRVLFDDEHGQALALVQLADDAEDLRDDPRREAERRLVEEHELRAEHQRAGQREHLLLAAAQRP